LLFFDQKNDTAFFFDRFLAVSVAVGIFFAVYYLVNGIGYGDVKYALVLAYAIGLEKLFLTFFFAACGGIIVYVMGFLCFQWKKTTRIPYAPFLSLGVCISLCINIDLIGFFL
jgi:prepilin signal peptidase PulO-like enzyme (type II secretory pathway)